MLEGGELCVCQIALALDLAQSTVSKHLSLLRAAGLVEERKDGRWAYIRLSESAVNEYALPLLALIHRWLSRDPEVMGDARRVRQLRKIPVDRLCSLSPQDIFAPGTRTRSAGRATARV
jgi:hypothetical protein